MNTYESLCQILVKDYQIEPDRLHPHTTLASLALDSLGVIELVFAIEDAFKIRVPDADAQSAHDFGNLGELTDYIDRLIETSTSKAACAAPVRRVEVDSAASP